MSDSETSIWFGSEPALEDINGILDSDAVGLMGMRFTEVGPAHLKASLPLSPRTRQTFGLLHGGVSCVVAETLGSIMANLTLDRDRQYAVGVEINASHLGSASGEGSVHAVVRPIKIGGSLQTTETRIHDDSGKLCCIARLTTMTRDQRAEGPASWHREPAS